MEQVLEIKQSLNSSYTKFLENIVSKITKPITHLHLSKLVYKLSYGATIWLNTGIKWVGFSLKTMGKKTFCFFEVLSAK